MPRPSRTKKVPSFLWQLNYWLSVAGLAVLGVAAFYVFYLTSWVLTTDPLRNLFGSGHYSLLYFGYDLLSISFIFLGVFFLAKAWGRWRGNENNPWKLRFEVAGFGLFSFSVAIVLVHDLLFDYQLPFLTLFLRALAQFALVLIGAFYAWKSYARLNVKAAKKRR